MDTNLASELPKMCSCGSGLSAARCCGLDMANLPPRDPERDLTPRAQAAIAAHQAGEIEKAEQLSLEVLEAEPDRVGALSVLYEIRKSQGQRRAADALIRRIVALEPNNLVTTNEYAMGLLSRGALAEAEIQARRAIRIAPLSPQAHNLMGMVLTEAQRPQAGEYHYRNVLELSGRRDPIVLANLAWNLKTQGRMEESRELYRESAAASPNIRQTLLGWARLEEADRKFEAASEILDRVEPLAPNDPGLLLSRAVLLGRMKRFDEALATLKTLAGQTGELGPNELQEKGRLLDRMGRYDEAADAFEAGKTRLRELSGYAYQDEVAAQLIGRLKTFFIAKRVKTLPRAAVRRDVAQPIFVLGFPRSGTTLMEQTLSAHPRIVAGDELPILNDLTMLTPRMLNSPLMYPEALTELWMGDQREGLENLRDHYLQKVRQMGVLRPEAAWFTDKMPLNETHLGLIALIFPQSPLVHVIRHPLDVMVSALANHFSHGARCASSLETAATHYVRVMDLVQHYRAEMPLRYLSVRYEDMIADQETTVRTVLDFIGEPFDPRCLQFHENQRYARTASYAQVAEPLYDSSRYRYRHYRQRLEPVIPILAPVIERLGYAIA